MLYKLIAFNARYIHSCLALFYVRAALEKNLPDCYPEIIQKTINDPYYPTLRQIGSGEPQALFFSVYIWNSTYILRLLRDLVKLLPSTPIILGGPQSKSLARNLPPDVAGQCTIITGEIEGVTKSFYQDMREKKLQRQYDCSKVPSFKSPYRRDDFAGILKNRHIYYETSRGCPFACTYCLSATQKGLRHLAVWQVKNELIDILKHEPKVIRFVDRTFNDLPERALEIWRFLVKKPGRTLFHFEMAPERFTGEMLRFLEQVGPGRFQFEIGVQSTNPETLAAINRKSDPAKLQENIRQLASINSIHLHLDLILGLPYENRQSFARSFAEVFALGPHYIQMGLLKILPDTPIFKCIDEFSMVVCENPPFEILANRWLAPSELAKLYWFGECVEAFYNNRFFWDFWNYLRRSGEDVFLFFEALLRLCRQKNFFNQAPTQELLSALLYGVTRSRSDKELITELLVFGWLRCGHRFLPDHLAGDDIALLKKKLWEKMPQNWPGVYDHTNRSVFFKQGFFMRFSGELLKEIGLSGETAGYICFQPKRENTVFRFNRIHFIPAAILAA